jgi:plastocyanin
MRAPLRFLLAIFGLLCGPPLAVLAWAAVSHAIAQKDRTCQLSAITIAAGDTLLFTNEDPFLHQIYVKSPTMNFESSEQPPGKTVEVPFAEPGSFEVRCHIHPKMSLTVTVK